MSNVVAMKTPAEFPDETPIDRIDLPGRAISALQGAGLATVGKVRQAKDRELLRLYGLGRTALKAIRMRIPYDPAPLSEPPQLSAGELEAFVMKKTAQIEGQISAVAHRLEDVTRRLSRVVDWADQTERWMSTTNDHIKTTAGWISTKANTTPNNIPLESMTSDELIALAHRALDMAKKKTL